MHALSITICIDIVNLKNGDVPLPQMVSYVLVVMNMVDTILDQMEYLHECGIQFHVYIAFQRSSWEESYREYHIPFSVVQYDIHQHVLIVA